MIRSNRHCNLWFLFVNGKCICDFVSLQKKNNVRFWRKTRKPSKCCFIRIASVFRHISWRDMTCRDETCYGHQLLYSFKDKCNNRDDETHFTLPHLCNDLFRVNYCPSLNDLRCFTRSFIFICPKQMCLHLHYSKLTTHCLGEDIIYNYTWITTITRRRCVSNNAYSVLIVL